MDRKECLTSAEQCICTDRNEQYGEPEDNFKVIADLWNAYLNARMAGFKYHYAISSANVADMMMLFKVGRNATAQTPKSDTYIDIAGYAACGCEIATEGRKESVMKHDGCDKCAYYGLGEDEFPCMNCKSTAIPGSDEYELRKDFWEEKR